MIEVHRDIPTLRFDDESCLNLSFCSAWVPVVVSEINSRLDRISVQDRYDLHASAEEIEQLKAIASASPYPTPYFGFYVASQGFSK